MYRVALEYLRDWKSKAGRKPLVIRGARQVGKSFLVQMFGADEFDTLLEVNFEQHADAASLFESKSPQTIVPLLEARFNCDLKPGRGLLFLDEIQAAPEVFSALRYFHEQMPELHVIAAGSLLEFVLEDHSFSMPVGRVEYLHLGPMQFEEFLLAMGQDRLKAFLDGYAVGEPVPEAIHSELLRLLRQFLVIGGMPEAVRVFSETGSYRDCDAIKASILSTYRDDFSKYRKRVPHDRIDKVFTTVPQLVGGKFKYSQVDRDSRAAQLRAALDLLCLARVTHRVRHTAANGLPLGAEADDRSFKVLFMDVGLLCSSCGLSAADIETAEDVMLVNSGVVCEQFVGQHLLHSRPFYEDPDLHCWIREGRSTSAEVDYVTALGREVVPVEVKAGKTGTLKSLHVFLAKKDRSFGLRFNSDLPSFLDATASIANLPERPFRLLSLPLYMVGQAMRLCREVLERD